MSKVFIISHLLGYKSIPTIKGAPFGEIFAHYFFGINKKLTPTAKADLPGVDSGMKKKQFISSFVMYVL